MEDYKWAFHFCVQMNSNHNEGKMESFLEKYPWGLQPTIRSGVGGGGALPKRENHCFGQHNYKIYFKNKYQKQYDGMWS